MCVIRIGGQEAEYFELTVLGPIGTFEPTSYENWLRADVKVAAGGFRGAVCGEFLPEELMEFHEQLTHLQGSLRGVANLETLEHWLSVRVTGDGWGHMDFQCEIRDSIVDGNSLTCTLALDQTFLPPFLRQLADAMRQFPSQWKGSAGGIP